MMHALLAYGEHPSGVLIKYRTPAGDTPIHVIEGVTLKQFEESLKQRRLGAMIQDAFSYLTPDQRELMMTGIGSEEWDELFNNNDEEEQDECSTNA